MQTKAPLSIPRSFEVIILSSSVKGVGRIIPTDVWEFVSERWLSIPRGWALSPSPESIFTNIRQLAEINNNDNIKNICFWQLEDPELFVKKYTKLNSFFMMKDTDLSSMTKSHVYHNSKKKIPKRWYTWPLGRNEWGGKIKKIYFSYWLTLFLCIFSCPGQLNRWHCHSVSP